jgi:hypothetical protein
MCGGRSGLQLGLVEAAPPIPDWERSRFGPSTHRHHSPIPQHWVALAHCLARHAADSQPPADLPPEILEEATFRAVRFGVAARLPDADGTRAGFANCSTGHSRRHPHTAPNFTPSRTWSGYQPSLPTAAAQAASAAYMRLRAFTHSCALTALSAADDSGWGGAGHRVLRS